MKMFRFLYSASGDALYEFVGTQEDWDKFQQKQIVFLWIKEPYNAP